MNCSQCVEEHRRGYEEGSQRVNVEIRKAQQKLKDEFEEEGECGWMIAHNIIDECFNELLGQETDSEKLLTQRSKGSQGRQDKFRASTKLAFPNSCSVPETPKVTHLTSEQMVKGFKKLEKKIRKEKKKVGK